MVKIIAVVKVINFSGQIKCFKEIRIPLFKGMVHFDKNFRFHFRLHCFRSYIMVNDRKLFYLNSCTIGQLFIILYRMSQAKLRNVVLFKTYFSDFYRKQRKDVQKKILWTLKLIEIVREIPVDYFKHLTGTNGVFEIRVQNGTDKFRIFCFFDKGRLLILGNGFHKKTQKTPQSDIDKALKIKSEYENKK